MKNTKNKEMCCTIEVENYDRKIFFLALYEEHLSCIWSLSLWELNLIIQKLETESQTQCIYCFYQKIKCTYTHQFRKKKTTSHGLYAVHKCLKILSKMTVDNSTISLKIMEKQKENRIKIYCKCNHICLRCQIILHISFSVPIFQ